MEKDKLALTSALNMIKRRWYSAHDLQLKLEKKDFEEADIQKAIVFLKNKKMLDDVRYAKSWIKDRLNFNPKSKFLINRELKQKGISPSDITLAWQDIEQELDTDETEIALNLAKRKIQTLKSLPKETQKRRLASFLARRGYSYEIIKKSLAILDNQD
ncbi:MAG: regulatory protein RecX [bacterium]|nr:regulatory protein RecX [bacterium]